jgi:hypothetical protein
VAAEVEAIAVADDRAGEAADLLPGLEDDDRRLGGGAAARPGTEYGNGQRVRSWGGRRHRGEDAIRYP